MAKLKLSSRHAKYFAEQDQADETALSYCRGPQCESHASEEYEGFSILYLFEGSANQGSRSLFLIAVNSTAHGHQFHFHSHCLKVMCPRWLALLAVLLAAPGPPASDSSCP
ncbi:Ribosomal protein S12 methylthiotransferase [Frankliniella fusca]|uniref:Ribosomal protein S12 methylthiotransferase n=1 Tax=Frankliniella fusca TaxID=407009 RepID=A0AAE1LEJ0_9NEOP|nr:Ribosomal protein S12 methylthiotransferase [Frankliniella fusca]